MNLVKMSSTCLLALLSLVPLVERVAPLFAQPPRGTEVKEERQFQGHTSAVYGVSFLENGKTAMSWSFDQTVRRWDVESGQETAKYSIKMVNDIAILPDGKTAILARGQSIGTQRVTIFDLDKGEVIAEWRGHEMSVNWVRLFPDGKSAVTASSDGTAILWEIDSGKKIHDFVAWRQGEGDGLPAGLPRQAGGVAIAVSPDGKLLTTGTSRNMTVAIWDVKTGKEIRSWPSGHGEVGSVEFSQDGKHLLTATVNHQDAGAQLWAVENGKLVRDWLIGNVSFAVFSPDGKRFLTTDVRSQVLLWEIDSQVALRKFVGHENWVTRATFAPDGKTALSTGYDNTVRLWKLPE